MARLVLQYLHRYFSDPWVMIAWIVAIILAADLGARIRDERPYLPAVDWATHAHCVALARSIIDHGSMPSERFRQDNCPKSVWAGVVCGWIDDEECQRRLRHRPSP